MSSTIKLSIVIVGYNSAQFLQNCLKSIFSQTPPFQLEVIVVDNASTDNSVSLIRQHYPQTKIISNEENKGFACGNNQGICQSLGQYILLLNPDTVVLDPALERLVDYIEATPDVGAVGPKIFNLDGSLQRTGVSFPSVWNLIVEVFFLDVIFPKSRLFGRHRRLYEDPNQINEVDYVQGSCLLIRKNILDDIGSLDESFFIFFEETDLCFRLKKAGWNVLYFPDASIIHYGRGGLGYYDDVSLVQFHRSYLRFIKKHYSIIHQYLFRCVLFIRSLVRSITLSFAGLFIGSRREEFFSRSQGYWNVALLTLKAFDE
ncbi:MAG TPA: glycosyltransferase family 2 protein [Bacteroidota bacterium]|nr:glycosyltransferase family 2 protein [Bacteroidota bacterium]